MQTGSLRNDVELIYNFLSFLFAWDVNFALNFIFLNKNVEV